MADLRPAIACVGRGTARKVNELGGKVALVSGKDTFGAGGGAGEETRGGGVALAQALLQYGATASARVLFPRADRGGEALIAALRAQGVMVHDVVAYRTLVFRDAFDWVRRELASGRLDGIALASASASEALLEAAGSAALTAAASHCLISVMGPSTAAPLMQAGIAPIRIGLEMSFEALAMSFIPETEQT